MDPQFDLYQALGVIVSTAIVALAQRAWVWLNRSTGNQAIETLTTAAPAAVHAAEELEHQLAKVSDTISSEEKLNFATAKLVELAKLGHIKLSDEQAKAIIEGTLNQARPYMESIDTDMFAKDVANG